MLEFRKKDAILDAFCSRDSQDDRKAIAKYQASDKGRAAAARYKSSQKGREAQRRANQKQDEKRKRERLLQAERRRVQALLDLGIVEAMSEQERHQWLQQCGDVNPIMAEVLCAMGVKK